MAQQQFGPPEAGLRVLVTAGASGIGRALSVCGNVETL